MHGIMKTIKVTMLTVLASFILLSSVQVWAEEDASTSSREYLNTLNAGITSILDPTAYDSEQTKEAVEELAAIVADIEPEPVEEQSDLFMANVNNSVNVREEPSEEAEKAGLLYKDCGGRILERGDDWTRVQSGDLVGWVSNEYLLFDEDAENLAGDVGFKILTVKTDALRIRMDPDIDAGVLALVADGDELEVVDDSNPDWIEVDYEGDTGYVSSEYVDITFSIDAGETIEAIKIREAEEEEARKKAALAALKVKNAAIVADGNDTRLLAALIQCEAGVKNYDGQLAVGSVVMNRVRSGAYPNTISGVIYASGQFTPALNGKVASVYNGKVYDSCIQAAQAALNGESNVGGATHFRRAGNHEGVEIGGQVFW